LPPSFGVSAFAVSSAVLLDRPRVIDVPDDPRPRSLRRLTGSRFPTATIAGTLAFKTAMRGLRSDEGTRASSHGKPIPPPRTTDKLMRPAPTQRVPREAAAVQRGARTAGRSVARGASFRSNRISPDTLACSPGVSMNSRRDGSAHGRHRPPPRPDTVAPLLVPGYEIVEQLGRGGMGVVYMAPARRAQPYRRAQDDPRDGGGRRTAALPDRGRGVGPAPAPEHRAGLRGRHRRRAARTWRSNSCPAAPSTAFVNDTPQPAQLLRRDGRETGRGAVQSRARPPASFTAT